MHGSGKGSRMHHTAVALKPWHKILKSKQLVFFFICGFVLFLECKDGFVRFWKTKSGQQIMAMKIDEEVENIKQEQDKVIEVLLWED